MKVLTMLLAAGLAVASDLVREAPQFTLESASGESVSLPRDQDGVDIYLFWATWCPYCKRLMPHLQGIEDEYGDRVTIFAINFRDDGDPGAFLEERGFQFVLLPDGDEVASRYDMYGTPGLVLVDGEGAIRFNLYELQKPSGLAPEELDHGQRAERLAPWWAAEIRQAVDEILSGPGEPAQRKGTTGDP